MYLFGEGDISEAKDRYGRLQKLNKETSGTDSTLQLILHTRGKLYKVKFGWIAPMLLQ